MTLTALFDVPAPAKLNLFLHIVGRREDGYHLLQSVFVLIDWADRLDFELRRDGRLTRRDIGSVLPEDDLCLRAARALQAATATPLGADITITKQVPSGAGMGGGSSDAATTLLALNRLWDLGMSRAALADIGVQLGADVPFFIGGRNALVQGIGEKVTPLSLQPGRFAVVKPPASIATGQLFTHPGVRRDTLPAIVAGSFDGAPGRGVAMVAVGEIEQGWGRNDMQDAALSSCADAVLVAGWLLKQFGNARMTGSGSAFFSRLADDSPASPSSLLESGASDVLMNGSEQLPPGSISRICLGLAEHPLRAWAV